MGLPKIDVPTYTLEVPSTKETLIYRPFLVKEEKILLMALEGIDNPLYEEKPELAAAEILNAVKQIITNCIITPGFDTDKLQAYDLEYIFLQLRIRAQGKDLELRFQPIKDSECEDCKVHRIVKADLTEANVYFNPEHTNKIELTDQVGIVMLVPNFKTISDLERARAKKQSKVEDYFKVVWECVDYLYDAEKTYSKKDFNLKEGLEFFENLKPEQFAKLDKFFDTLPKLTLTVNVKCNKCGFSEVYPLVGLENFFV